MLKIHFFINKIYKIMYKKLNEIKYNKLSKDINWKYFNYIIYLNSFLKFKYFFYFQKKKKNIKNYKINFGNFL